MGKCQGHYYARVRGLFHVKCTAYLYDTIIEQHIVGLIRNRSGTLYNGFSCLGQTDKQNVTNNENVFINDRTQVYESTTNKNNNSFNS